MRTLRSGRVRRIIARPPVAPLLLALVLALTGMAADRPREVTLSVAISMKEAVEALGQEFMRAHPGVVLRYNFGASGNLEKQIEAGAPIDLFVSAGQAEMDVLERKGLIVAGTRRVFARNVLAVVAPSGARLELSRPADLLRPEVRRIVIGDPRLVPAGQYSRECLRALGLWEALRAKLVFAENVRQALWYVARGEVDAGFVYATDVAVGGRRVKEVFRPPRDSYGPVLYPAAVVAGGREPGLARAFLDLLAGPGGRAGLARLGFLPPAGPGR